MKKITHFVIIFYGENSVILQLSKKARLGQTVKPIPKIAFDFVSETFAKISLLIFDFFCFKRKSEHSQSSPKPRLRPSL